MHASGTRRRGAVAVLVALAGTLIIAFAALAIDYSYLTSTDSELQRSADAAALAAASLLISRNTADESMVHAFSEAAALTLRNRAAQENVEMEFDDLVFGSYSIDASGRPTFIENFAGMPSAVRVNVRRSNLPLFFGGGLGHGEKTLGASAAAALAPRDIVVVIDLSGSMKYDSDLRFYHQTQVNARDIWASLDGPAPSRPYVPGPEHATEYADDLGPVIGAMAEWGTPVNPTDYDPTTDPGLWHLPRGADSTSTGARSSLLTRGFAPAVVDQLLSGANDGVGDQWRNRVAVITGLANWSVPANWDGIVRNGDIEWIALPPYRKNWQWRDYISWADGSGNKLINTHPQFKHRFGLKTYTDWLLDAKDHSSKTMLTHTPEEPVTAIKDAVQEFVRVTGDVDLMGLATFGSTGRHEISLTSNRQVVADTLYNRQANHWDNSTNIGGGMQIAINELTSERARQGVRKIMVVMSDGSNKRGPDARAVAADAAEEGITVYTVSVGYTVDRDLMQDIAEATGGREFYAFGDPDEYTEQLREIFRQIGGIRDVWLIE